MMYIKGKSPTERFWLHVNKDGKLMVGMDNNCWEWISKSKRKYPQIKVGNDVISPAKFIWEQENGKIKNGKFVIHRCNNIWCVRLDHLILGDVSDLRSKLIIDRAGNKLRKCSGCGNLYKFSDEHFGHDISSPSGLGRRCKKCDVLATKRSQVDNWEKHLMYQTRMNAQDRNLIVEIDEEYILELFNRQHGKCFWFGVDLIPSGMYKYPYKPSVDRLDISKGYTKDNVVLSSLSANFARNSSNIDDFMHLLSELSKCIDTAMWRSFYG